jgi:hypothetical protein
MEHVVFFPSPDGSPSYRRLSSLDEAVSFVEHLRNERDVAEVSVHTLTDVPLAFRTVYRVEVAGSDAVVPAPAEAPAEAPVAEAPVAEVAEVVEPVAEVAEVVEPAAEVVEPVEAPAEAVADEPVAAAAGNGAGDTRSLGFFAS